VWVQIQNICLCRSISLLISETVQVTMVDHYYDFIYTRSSRVNSSDIEWPVKTGASWGPIFSKPLRTSYRLTDSDQNSSRLLTWGRGEFLWVSHAHNSRGGAHVRIFSPRNARLTESWQSDGNVKPITGRKNTTGRLPRPTKGFRSGEIIPSWRAYSLR